MANYQPLTPLVETNHADDAQPSDGQDFAGIPGMGAALPVSTNFAEDVAIVLPQITEGVIPLINDLRSRRRPLEQEWQAIRRMDLMVRDDGARYDGRTKAYLPVWARTNNTLISTITKGLFPSDDYMDVYDRGTGDSEVARALKAYMQYEFENVAQVPRYMKPCIRQYNNYGPGVQKIWYKKDLKRLGRMKMGQDATLMPEFSPESPDEGLCVSTRDLFNVWVFPETAESPRDILFVMEDVQVARNYIEHMGRTKRWANVEAALTAPDTWAYNRQQLLSDAASMADTQYFKGNSIGELLTLTECWCWLKLPPAAYLPDEDKELPVHCRVVMAGNTPVQVIRNPYFHQCAPYLFGRQMVQPGYFYGQGSGRLVRGLQYLANDFANQMNDVGIYSLNPILKINPGYIIGPPPSLRPGVVFKMTDIEKGMSFDRPPLGMFQEGQLMMSMYLGMVQDFGGAPPGTGSGIAPGKGAKTATGAQILQRNALSPLQDQIEDLERDMMIPMMRGAWRNAMQFRDGNVVLKVMGQPMMVTPKDIAIDAEFRWTASSQASSQQQRSQQAMQFLQGILPFIPVLNQQGYVVNPEPVLKRIFNDGLGFRGWDEVIKMAAQPAMAGAQPPSAGGMQMPPGGGMPSQGSPANAQQADLMRSALDQVNGQAPGTQHDMAPGEGTDIHDVRSTADEISAAEGARAGGN